MKTGILILTLVIMSGLGVVTTSAQQGVVSAGGEATGSGGTMSFSTGQTGFQFFSSEAGSIQFGLQQVFFFEEEIPFVRELITDDLVIGEDQCFDAYETIILAGGGDTFIVDSGTGVDLIAGQSILMLPVTMVEYGGYLSARISTDGLFCDAEEPIVASFEVYAPDNTAHQVALATQKFDDPDKTFFRVYPNPTTGDFTVEIMADNIDLSYSIEVYGMRGEIIIRNDQLTGWQLYMTLQEHQPGLYMIRVQRGEQMGVERIIKR